MVKNTTGGTGTKSLGRKYQSSGFDKRLRLSENEFEKYACVTKMLGNGMCEIHTSDNMKLMGHIRKKFKGKNKRNNLVSLLSIVLVGLRDYENPPKNCDIMIIYDDIQVDQIRSIPSINIENIYEMRNTHSGIGGGSAADNNIEFTAEEEDEPDEKLGSGKVSGDFVMTDTGMIDIDDI